MKIRKVKKTDKTNYVNLQKDSFPNINLRRESEFFDIKLKNKEIIIIEENGKYLGHIAFSQNKVEPPFGNSVFIQELAINKLSRGKGLGTKLVLALIKYCKKLEVPVIYLGTGDYKENKTHNFYKRLGFKKIGKLDEISPDSEYDYGQIFYGKVI